MYYKPTFEAFLATFNNLLRYICSSLSSWLFDILYQISELNTSLLMSTDSLETKAISKKNWPKLVRFNIDIIVDSSFTLIHSVLNVLFIRPNSAGMVSRGYETAKRLLVSGLWGEGDPKRPKKNLLSPETMRPKETQGESLEFRDYATVSELPDVWEVSNFFWYLPHGKGMGKQWELIKIQHFSFFEPPYPSPY